MKEKVLEVKEVARSSRDVIYQIIYQDEEVLKRGKFSDEELGIISDGNPEYHYKCLYIKGEYTEQDDNFLIMRNENERDFLDKIEKLNNKYGKRWRADYKERYYYLDNSWQVNSSYDLFVNIDKYRYEMGNYFKTETEAEIARIKIKKLLLEG